MRVCVHVERSTTAAIPELPSLCLLIVSVVTEANSRTNGVCSLRAGVLNSSRTLSFLRISLLVLGPLIRGFTAFAVQLSCPKIKSRIQCSSIVFLQKQNISLLSKDSTMALYLFSRKNKGFNALHFKKLC